MRDDSSVELWTMWQIRKGLDIDRDGTDEPVYFVTTDECEALCRSARNHLSILPHVWSTETNEMSLCKSSSRDDYPEGKSITKLETKMFSGVLLDDVISFFNFDGLTYFDASSTPTNSDVPIQSLSIDDRRQFEEIVVYEIDQGRRNAICRIRAVSKQLN